MPLKVKDRTYDSDDLQKLMNHVAGWAQSWDDVLWYLKTVAPHDHELFWRERVQAMLSDVEHLKRTHARFTTDYREVYQEITGQECQSCSSPRVASAPVLHPRRIADKWLEGLRLPAQREDILERARCNHAPQDVVRALEQLRRSHYLTVGELLQELWMQSQKGASRTEADAASV